MPLPNVRLDGKSLKHILFEADAPTPHDVHYWRVGKEPKAQWAVRCGNWKLLGNPRDTSKRGPLREHDRLFLVNLKDDIAEQANVAVSHPDTLKRLMTVRDRFEREMVGSR